MLYLTLVQSNSSQVYAVSWVMATVFANLLAGQGLLPKLPALTVLINLCYTSTMHLKLNTVLRVQLFHC